MARFKIKFLAFSLAVVDRWLCTQLCQSKSFTKLNQLCSMVQVAVEKIVVNIITFITWDGINHLWDRAKSANLMNNTCKNVINFFVRKLLIIIYSP
jgi:hypothetical protein